jgi:hypothetical protein
MNKNASGMDRAEDRTRIIDVLLNDIQNEVMSNNDLKWGHKYGIKKTGLQSLNLDGILVESFLLGVWKGLGLYYAELELKRLKEDTIEDDSILNIESKLTPRNQLALIKSLGILEHLSSRYNIVNEPTKLVKLVAEILGVDISNGKNPSFVADLNYLIRGNEMKGPSSKAAKKKIEGLLHSIGLTRVDLSPKINEKTRR